MKTLMYKNGNSCTYVLRRSFCWNCTLTNACRPISSFIKKSVHLLRENSL